MLEQRVLFLNKRVRLCAYRGDILTGILFKSNKHVGKDVVLGFPKMASDDAGETPLDDIGGTDCALYVAVIALGLPMFGSWGKKEQGGQV